MKERTVSIMVTEKCNLNCIYCYENNKSEKNMPFEIAKKIIDLELANIKNEFVTIDFFGGEPFLNFELIKQIVEYSTSNYVGNFRFFTTTNGTKVHGEVQDWLIKYKDIFTVGLSLDGVREAHNINRSKSFEEIDLDFFVRYYAFQPIKMTISKESLPYFSESIRFLTKKGFKITCNLAYMIDWLSPINASNLEKQLNSIIDYYLDNPQVEKCSMLNYRIEILAHPEKNDKFYQKYCGCGTTMTCYGIDGKSYPCQLFAPVSAGKKAIEYSEWDVNSQIKKSELPASCRTCYYQRICPICLGSNYLSTGDVFQIDEGRCNLYKMIFKANAKLRALEWDKGILKVDDEDGLLQSIVSIMS